MKNTQMKLFCLLIGFVLLGQTGVFGGNIISEESEDGKSADPIWIYDSDLYIRHVETSDLNGDGVLDVIAGEYDNTYYDNPSKVYAINGISGDMMWSYTLNDGVRSMTIGDLTNDGVDDVIIGASKGSSTPDGRVHAIDGTNGSIIWIFTPGGTGDTNGDVAVGHFNGDGYLDVAVACWDDYVYAINGFTGTEMWSKHIGSIFINSVSTGDVNGDNIDDVAFAHSYLAGWDNYHGVINGATGNYIWMLTELNSVENCLLADFNDDSVLEAVFAVQTPSDDVVIQTRNSLTGALLWSYTLGSTTLSANGFLFAYDVDADGDKDLVVGNEYVANNIFVFDGTSASLMWMSETLSGYPRDIAFGDVVGDTQLNIIAATYDRVQVLEADGTKTWYYSVAGTIRSVGSADFNGDGILDVAAGGGADNSGSPPNPAKSVWALKTIQSPLLWEHTFGEYGNALAIADLNDDAYLDVVTVCSLDDKATAINGKTGESLWTWVGTQNLYAVTTGDFDNDGHADVVVAGNDEQVTALNGSTGSVMWQFTTPTDQIYRKCLQTLDVNTDGFVDVIAGADDSKVYAIDGATGTQLWERHVGAAVNEVEIAQMDGNGPEDIVVAVGIGGNGEKISVLNGLDGTILWEQTMPEAVEHVEVFDVTNDGIPDVAAAITPYTPLHVTIVDGATQTTIWTQNIPIASNTHSMAHGDLNFDGVPDLIVPGRSTDKKVTALNGLNGATIWEYQTNGEINTVAVSDLDGDSLLDVVAGSDDQNVYAIRGYDGSPLWSYSTADDVMHIQIGDISGNSRPNIACVTFGSDGVAYAFRALPPAVNLPPNPPSNPNPADQSHYNTPSITLSWTGGDPNPQDTVTYDVYFGTTPTVTKVASNITQTSYIPAGLNYNTTYYWQIVSWDNNGLNTIGSIWSFATEWNNPPYTPHSPTPADNASNISITPILTWVGGDPDSHTVTYDVNFGTTPNPPKVAANTTNTFNPGTLQYYSQYYWRITAWDSYGKKTVGPEWKFSTIDNQPPNQPTNPIPANESTDIYIHTELSWACTDPEAHALLFDVYFEADDTTPDVLVASQISDPEYLPNTLEYNTKYYWQIIAYDSYGKTTIGPIWHFTTEPIPIPDLEAEGSLSWIDVPAGSTQTGEFIIRNIGEQFSQLNWEVRAWPEWGNWTITPMTGQNLTPIQGDQTISVEVILPNEKNTDFSGEITIVNIDNPNDTASILIAVSTPTAQIQSPTAQLYKNPHLLHQMIS